MSDESRSRGPAGWPAGVRLPDADDWVETARAWLLDQCPHHYRAHPVITRHPVVLARLAVHHVAAQLQAQRAAAATLRQDLAGALAQSLIDPGVVERTFEVLEAEQSRLAAASRGARVVEQALRGQRRAARL